jgi:hypothetical protein
MPEIDGGNERTKRRRTGWPMILRIVLATSTSIGRRIKGPMASWKLRATLGFAVLLIIALALAGVLISERGGNGQRSATPDTGGTSYTPGSLVPTDRWVNFYGLECTIDGQPLSVGALITALDPQGVVCGEFRVTQAGRYGLMPVYGDDPLTKVDEGAVAGDSLRFLINGIQAVVTGPDKPVWTAMGDLKQVNLAASTAH